MDFMGRTKQAALVDRNQDAIDKIRECLLDEHQVTPTERAIWEMMTENTGRGICDSGGAYGRNWERNQIRDFKAEPRSRFRIDADGNTEGTFDFSLNLFHWFCERVAFSQEMQDEFDAMVAAIDKDYENPYDDNPEWMQVKKTLGTDLWDAFRLKEVGEDEPDVAESYNDWHWGDYIECFMAWMAAKGHEVAGVYGEGKPFSENIYNGEHIVDGIFQYTYMTIDQEPVVIIQYHGGCDVRGGYTSPRVFVELDDTAIMRVADATIRCTGEREMTPREKEFNENLLPGIPLVPPPEPCYKNWSTDDAYHWYEDGAAGYGAGKQFEAYDLKRLPDPEEWEQDGMAEWTEDDWLEFYDGKYTHGEWEQGVICFYENGDILCPFCGSRLELR